MAKARRCDRERGLAVRECQTQQPVVDAVHAVHQAFEAPQYRPDQRQPARAFGRVAPHGRQHRVQREADEQRHQHGRRDGNAERIEELADDAAHERDRNEHRDDRQRRRQHRQPDLVGALARGGVVVLAQMDVPDDVLAHDDRIVDQQSDAKRQRHQRHVVQREAERVEKDEGRDHRDRQREPGDDRAAPRPEEQEDDQHRQKRAFDDRVLDVVDRVFDEVGHSPT